MEPRVRGRVDTAPTRGGIGSEGDSLAVGLGGDRRGDGVEEALPLGAGGGAPSESRGGRDATSTGRTNTISA